MPHGVPDVKFSWTDGTLSVSFRDTAVGDVNVGPSVQLARVGAETVLRRAGVRGLEALRTALDQIMRGAFTFQPGKPGRKAAEKDRYSIGALAAAIAQIKGRDIVEIQTKLLGLTPGQRNAIATNDAVAQALARANKSPDSEELLSLL